MFKSNLSGIAVANNLTPSAAVRVIKNTIEAYERAELPKRLSRNV